MFVTDDDKKIKWYWLDRKMHEVAVNFEGEDLDLKEIHESCIKLVQDKSELCKKIYYLGISLSGTDEGGWGFLLGWLMRSIKKDQDWDIQHNELDVSEDEITEHLADIMEKTAQMLREKTGDTSSIGGVTPTMGGHNGTDLFK